MAVITIGEAEEVCANCEHYVQHYMIRTYPLYSTGIGEFMAVNDGHCVEPRVKRRKPSDTCGMFEKAS